MKVLNRFFSVAAVVLTLAACSSSQAPSSQSSSAPPPVDAAAVQAAHTVDWYKANNSERKAMLATCRNNSGTLRQSPDCVNAGDAQAAVTWGAKGGITDVKPVTFDPPSHAASNPPQKGN